MSQCLSEILINFSFKIPLQTHCGARLWSPLCHQWPSVWIHSLSLSLWNLCCQLNTGISVTLSKRLICFPSRWRASEWRVMPDMRCQLKLITTSLSLSLFLWSSALQLFMAFLSLFYLSLSLFLDPPVPLTSSHLPSIHVSFSVKFIFSSTRTQGSVALYGTDRTLSVTPMRSGAFQRSLLWRTAFSETSGVSRLMHDINQGWLLLSHLILKIFIWAP